MIMDGSRIEINRLRTPLAILLCVFGLLVGATAAHANVFPVPGGSTTDARSGGHGDLSASASFTYSNSNEDIRRIVTDLPTGGIGNPNAVPYADRCLKATFSAATCDEKALIGRVKLTVTILGFLPLNLTGKIYILQTTPEIPTDVGVYIAPPVPGITEAIRTLATFYPVTEGPDNDLRVRSVTEPLPRTTKVLGITTPIQITYYEQILLGRLANGNAFITNPTRCDTWFSYGYMEAYDSNTNADSDPLLTGTNNFIKTAAYPTTPDCGTVAPFNAAADAVVNGPTRGAPASFSTEITIPDSGDLGQSSAAPKSVVATIPDALNIDVQQLGRICSNEDFAARSCPPATKVGTATVTTPVLVDQLHGEAYLVRASPGRNLPDLGLIVRGPVGFSLRGTNRYVNGTQLETTYDNLPQTGFTKFSLTISGGANGLLLVDRCPLNGSEPNDGGSTRFGFTSYQGESRSVSSPTKYTPPSCLSYSVTLKSSKRCVRKRSLRIKPRIKSPGQVRFVKFYVNNKFAKKVKRSPFRATVKLSKRLRANKTYRYKVKVYFKPTATFPKGRVRTKSAKFKLCGLRA